MKTRTHRAAITQVCAGAMLWTCNNFYYLQNTRKFIRHGGGFRLGPCIGHNSLLLPAQCTFNYIFAFISNRKTFRANNMLVAVHIALLPTCRQIN